MRRFPIDPNYGLLLQSQNISVDEVLRRASLPGDLFARKEAALTEEEYIRFMASIQESVKDFKLPIMLATADNIETISPPIFAAYCSRDGEHCIRRLAQYKALAGAVHFDIAETNSTIAVNISASTAGNELPEIIIGVEMVLLLNLIRKATKRKIIPCKVTVKKAFANPEYAAFMKCEIEVGKANSICFSIDDARIPFISRNDSMWSFFEPELKKRLSQMETDDTFAARVRSALVELLPSGECTIDDVCTCLAISKRTLQRKLAEEDTTFQKQLNHTRELLAKNYLSNTDLPSEDIAFLLGYREVNSFFRAFTAWTGMGVGEYKNNLK